MNGLICTRRPIFWLITLLCGVVSGSPLLQRNKRVVGGFPTDIENIPYQVAMVIDDFPICGGAIIREDVIVTAAHCCCSYLPNETTIYAGMFSKEALKKRKGVKIKELRIHEKYNYTGEATPDDIALIVLEEKLVFGPTIQKIDMADEPYNLPVNATVSGWGSTNCNFSLSSDEACNGWYATELQSGMLTVTKREDKLIYAPHTRISGNYGDSGGPIVANNKLIGISRNCDIVEPFIFDFDGTSILDYLPWVKQTLKSIHEQQEVENIPEQMHESNET